MQTPMEKQYISGCDFNVRPLGEGMVTVAMTRGAIVHVIALLLMGGVLATGITLFQKGLELSQNIT